MLSPARNVSKNLYCNAFKSVFKKRYYSRLREVCMNKDGMPILSPSKHFCISRHYSSESPLNSVFSDESKQQFLNSLSKVTYKDKGKNKRDAAVLIPLCNVNGEPSVLLTVRSWKMGRNKGDISFPGGMGETSDKDVIDLALRETEEEIGISSEVVQVWTKLPSISMNKGSLKVTPVVAFLGDVKIENCSVNPNEVEEVFTLTLKSLCAPENFYFTEFKSGYALPSYIVGRYRVWGLTAGILHQFLALLLPSLYLNKLPVLKLKKQKHL